MINAHFIAHEITNNAQLKAHYLLLIVCIILMPFLLCISLTPKHLKLSAGGMPSGNFVNNSDEGYRTLVEKQNHPKPLNLKATQKNGGYGLERTS